MSNNIKEIIDHPLVRNVVAFRACQITRRFPKTYDFEDAKQELWEAVVKAVQKYDGTGEIVQYVTTEVYRKYGNFINQLEYKRAAWYESQTGFLDYPVEDDSFEKVNANCLLDQIESTLEKESKKSKQYQIALDWFKLLRKDVTIKEASKSLNISESYFYVLRHRIFKDLVIDHPELQV